MEEHGLLFHWTNIHVWAKRYEKKTFLVQQPCSIEVLSDFAENPASREGGSFFAVKIRCIFEPKNAPLGGKRGNFHFFPVKKKRGNFWPTSLQSWIPAAPQSGIVKHWIHTKSSRKTNAKPVQKVPIFRFKDWKNWPSWLEGGRKGEEAKWNDPRNLRGESEVRDSATEVRVLCRTRHLKPLKKTYWKKRIFCNWDGFFVVRRQRDSFWGRKRS